MTETGKRHFKPSEPDQELIFKSSLPCRFREARSCIRTPCWDLPKRALTTHSVRRHTVGPVDCPISKDVGRNPHSTESRGRPRPGPLYDEKALPLQALSLARFREGAISTGRCSSSGEIG